MFQRESSYDEIIHSAGGQHISLYLNNDRRLRHKVHFFIDQIQRILLQYYSLDETRRLVDPLYKVLRDQRTFSHLGEHFAVFKKNNYLRLINIPRPVKDFFVLSETFHVKPLLSSSQEDSSGTLVFCERNRVQLIAISGRASRVVSEFRLDSIIGELARLDEKKLSQSYFLLGRELLLNWLEESIALRSRQGVSPFFIYGEQTMAQFIHSCFKSVTAMTPEECLPVFHPIKQKGLDWSRTRLVQLKNQWNKKRLYQFSLVNEDEFISFDFQEILHGLLSGQVTHLMVAKDQNIFGKIDRLKGEITFTHFHKDHEDDDVLDDLSQLAIEHDVDPFLVRKGVIGKQRPIKAILKKSRRTRIHKKIHSMEVA